MLLQVGEVSNLGRCRRHYQIAVGGDAGQREVGLDATPLVEPLGVDDASRRYIDIGGADTVQHLAGVAPLHHEFWHRRLVEQGHCIPRGTAFFGGVVEPVLVPEAVLVARL